MILLVSNWQKRGIFYPNSRGQCPKVAILVEVQCESITDRIRQKAGSSFIFQLVDGSTIRSAILLKGLLSFAIIPRAILLKLGGIRIDMYSTATYSAPCSYCVQ
jgi:hypothetical protein